MKKFWTILFGLVAAYTFVSLYGTLRSHSIEVLQSLGICLVFASGVYRGLWDIKKEFT